MLTETTEATNNILDETIAKMLTELGEITPDQNSVQLVSEANSMTPIVKEDLGTSETMVFDNALSTFQRLQEIEDIRAIFQILGIGS